MLFRSAYRLRLQSLDDLLLNIRKEESRKAFKTKDLSPDDIANARLKIKEIDTIRMLIGMPPPNARVLQSKDQWDKAPSGSIWIVPDPSTGSQQLLTKP